MFRKLMFLVATVGFLVVASSTPATAQLGEYQKKILKHGTAGAKAGAKIAGWPGGVTGGLIGAAYGDHKHHQNKVHNYRTKPTVTVVNNWHRRVYYRIFTSRGWVVFWLEPGHRRRFLGPVQVRFDNAVGMNRDVTMHRGTFTFHAQGNAVEMSW